MSDCAAVKDDDGKKKLHIKGILGILERAVVAE